MDQKVDKERYKLIPRTLIFVFNPMGEILLLKRSADKRFGGGKYNGIGGHIERGEGIITSARRELLEETGIDIDTIDLCGYVLIDTVDDLGVLLFILKSSITDRGGIEQTISIKEGLLRWVPLSGLKELSLIEDLQVILPKVEAWKHGDVPIALHYQLNRDGEMIIKSEI